MLKNYNINSTDDIDNDTILWQLQYIITSSEVKYPSTASDIHFEPYLDKEWGFIQCCVNGKMTDSIPATWINQYISEIKRLAWLNQNEHWVNQEWTMSVNFNWINSLFGVSIIPIGEKELKLEKAVLHINQK